MPTRVHGGMLAVVTLGLAGAPVIGLVATGGAPTPGTSPVVKKLAVKPLAQIQTNWCWAASSQMVMGYKQRSGSTDINQCTQAFRTLVGSSASSHCCNPTSDTELLICNHTNWPDFKDFGFKGAPSGGSTESTVLSWDDLVAEIDNDRPILFSIQWPSDVSNGGGHMGVVYGYEVDGQGNRIVHLYDPLPMPIPDHPDPDVRRGGREVTITYEQYQGYKTRPDFRYPTGPDGWVANFTHWRDYSKIQPDPGNH